jgi:hypothetical protein
MRTAAVMCALAALLSCSSADAARSTTITGPVVTFSGSVHVAFAGDPARGCAAAGTCGYSGTIDAPDTSALSGSFTGDFFGPEPSDVQNLAGARIQVLRSDASGSGTCTDELDDVGAGVAVDEVRGRVRLALNSATNPLTADGSPLDAGQCAGPRVVELPSIPARYVTLGTARHGASVALGGTSSFADGSFSGTVTSTLVAHVKLEQTGTEITGAGTVGPTYAAPTFVDVTLHLNVAAASATLPLGFASSPSPFCAPLDACGLMGTVALTTPAISRRVALDLGEELPAHAKATRARALRDLRAGRLSAMGLQTLGTVHISTTEAALRSTGPTCTDTVDTAVDGPNLSAPANSPENKLDITIGGSAFFPIGDPLRTRCPGPASPATEEPAPLLATHVSLSAFASGQPVSVTLVPGLTVSGTYAGSLAGALPMTLSATAKPTVKFS